MMKTFRALETWGSSSGLDGEHPHKATATSDLTARSVTLPRGGQARGEDVTAGWDRRGNERCTGGQKEWELRQCAGDMPSL